jgi:hypothetical protein
VIESHHHVEPEDGMSLFRQFTHVSVTVTDVAKAR